MFLADPEEVNFGCELLYERMKTLGPNVSELIILFVYTGLSLDIQSSPIGLTKIGYSLK